MVHRDGQRVLGAAAQPRRMAVLAMVARAGSRGISRDRLQATLWPDADEEQGKQALKQALYALRRDIGAGELFMGTRDLQLNPDEVASDVSEFEEALRSDQHERAVTVCEGPFLDGFRLPSVPEFEAWMEEERRDLDRLLASTLDRLARRSMEQGDPAAAVRWSRRLSALEPLNARHTIQLMRALLAAGDRAGSLQQARIYEELIAQELDLPPDPGVVALAQEIRDGRVMPAAVPPPAVAPPTPVVPAQAAPVAPRPLDPGLAVAVLPFGVGTRDPDAECLSDGLTEELVYALGRGHDLSVSRVPSGSAFMRDGAPDLGAIRDRFGVGSVLEGNVRRAGDDVRVTARLHRAHDGNLLWSERYDRRMGNMLALQDELARAIADDVERELCKATGRPGAPSRRERADELYARGMRAWWPPGSGLGQGLELFRQAVALDPAHARAHAALAESYLQLAFYGFLPAPRAFELADAASREAFRLAPELAESITARGTCLLWGEPDFEAGTAELERAIAVDPSYVVAQTRLAFVRLCHDGPMDTGRAGAHRAATLVGATGHSRVMYGVQLLAAARYDEAIEALHAAIDIEAPSYLAYHWLCAAYVQKGMHAEAIAAAVAEASLSERHPWSLMSLIVACAAAGQVRRAETLLETLKARAATNYVQPSVFAQAHAALGDLDAGMSFLERAIEEHDPSTMMIKFFPMFAVFRRHPGFRALLHRAGWRDWDTAEYRVPG